MAELVSTPEQLFSKKVRRPERVLLINPPVEERRYHWLKWNQPLDLLRLSGWLKARDKKTDIRLFDFMLPDEGGNVAKHKVKHTWGAGDDSQLWHFGRPYDDFTKLFGELLQERWVPDCIVISSLTSYWHEPVANLLLKICQQLGPRLRKQVRLVLYGYYPRIEPEHAAGQHAADFAVTGALTERPAVPDFGLYLSAEERLPAFFSLDISDPSVAEHLERCLEIQTVANRKRKIARSAAITVAFFNDDICRDRAQLESVARTAERFPKQISFEGIAGIVPQSMTRENLRILKWAGFRSLFVEHARNPGGDIDEGAYAPLVEAIREEQHEKKSGRQPNAWLDRSGTTGFVSIGLPDDDIDKIVRSALVVNSYFHSIILKPFGYSPSFDRRSLDERRRRWPRPCESSPQWFPYAGSTGSGLTQLDYDNLIRLQNTLNMRVRGTTFDFLDDGNVARLARETLVAESWKPHRSA